MGFIGPSLYQGQATLRNEEFPVSLLYCTAILLQGSSLMWAKETNSNWFSQESCLPGHGPETSATTTGHTHTNTPTPRQTHKHAWNGTHKLKTPEMWSELDPNTTDLLFHNHLFSLSPTLVFIPPVSFFSAPLFYLSVISNDLSPHPVSQSPWCFATGSLLLLLLQCLFSPFDCQRPGSSPVFLTMLLLSELSSWHVFPTYILFPDYYPVLSEKDVICRCCPMDLRCWNRDILYPRWQ